MSRSYSAAFEGESADEGELRRSGDSGVRIAGEDSDDVVDLLSSSSSSSSESLYRRFLPAHARLLPPGDGVDGVSGCWDCFSIWLGAKLRRILHFFDYVRVEGVL